MSTKWNRELMIKEAATEIREVSSCNIDLGEAVEKIESRILDLAWRIPPGKISSATEAVIRLLVEEAFKD